MNSNYPPGVTGNEPYFNIPDEPEETCYECGAILGTDNGGVPACVDTTNMCRNCDGCDETCTSAQDRREIHNAEGVFFVGGGYGYVAMCSCGWRLSSSEKSNAELAMREHARKEQANV